MTTIGVNKRLAWLPHEQYPAITHWVRSSYASLRPSFVQSILVRHLIRDADQAYFPVDDDSVFLHLDYLSLERAFRMPEGDRIVFQFAHPDASSFRYAVEAADEAGALDRLESYCALELLVSND